MVYKTAISHLLIKICMLVANYPPKIDGNDGIIVYGMTKRPTKKLNITVVTHKIKDKPSQYIEDEIRI
jgi:hypothetical protein